MTTSPRHPYVGAGEDGARRSAQIDREEAETLSWSDPRHDELIASAERWEDQAHCMVLERLGPRPTLEQLREQVGNENWLAALALLDLSPVLAVDASRYTAWSRDSGTYQRDLNTTDPGHRGTFTPDAGMNWHAWVTDVDTAGRGWSTTEWRLFAIIGSIVIPERATALRGTFDGLGSWETDALRIIIEWATGGNQRDLPGRLTVITR